VDLRLGYSERDQTVADLLGIHQMIAGDPQVQHLYGPQQRYNVYKEVLEAKGHKDVDTFIQNPQTAPPPQPDPLQMLELQVKQKELEVMDRKMSLAEAEANHQAQLDEMKSDFDKRFKTLEFMLKSRDADRKDEETQNRIDVARTEMALAEKEEADAPPKNRKATAIISPNG
jgi:hypothetical protein